jgi:hypothetical protein
MLKINKQEIKIDDELYKKINTICSFLNVIPIIKSGSIRCIENTNISYVEPHTITINKVPILMFNGSNDIYIGNLNNKFKIYDLEKIIKSIKIIKKD